MTLDLTKPLQTRDGRPARIICTDRKCDNGFPLGVLIPNEYGVEEFFWYCADGRYNDSPSVPSGLDLQNAPVITEEWVNYYGDSSRCTYHEGTVYTTQKHADGYAAKHRQACFKVVRKDGIIIDVSLA